MQGKHRGQMISLGSALAGSSRLGLRAQGTDQTIRMGSVLAGSIGLRLRAHTGNRRAVDWLTRSKGELGTGPRTDCHISALGPALSFASYEAQNKGTEPPWPSAGGIAPPPRVLVRLIRAKRRK